MKRIEQFPPYGALARPYARQLKEPAAPLDFPSTGPALDAWLAWLDETVAVINGCLWPSWNHAENRWQDPDIDRMNDLTRADFAILKSLIETDYLSVTSPDSNVWWRAKHLEFFLDEDQDRLGHRIGEYSGELPVVIGPYDRWVKQIFPSKIGHTSMHLKHRLQRPRPYQVAALAGANWFAWNLGVSSMTPSMSSGHALQGLLLAAGTFEGLLQHGVELSTGARTGLAQFGADVGDRRVFAGIHYPTDNVASWIAVGRLARKIFHRTETREFIHFAVTARSEVYKRLVDAMEQHPILERALAELKAAVAPTQ